jgi:hypothetical protein
MSLAQDLLRRGQPMKLIAQKVGYGARLVACVRCDLRAAAAHVEDSAREAALSCAACICLRRSP